MCSSDLDGGLFPQGFHGFAKVFQIAVFSFVGTELIGTTAAEARDPEVTLRTHPHLFLPGEPAAPGAR